MGRKKSKRQKEEIKRFGEKLLTLRILHGLTQIGLAQQLGYSSHSHIVSLEKGQKPPTLETVLNIARLFNVTTDVLLKDELELETSDADESVGRTPRSGRIPGAQQTERTDKQDCNKHDNRE